MGVNLETELSILWAVLQTPLDWCPRSVVANKAIGFGCTTSVMPTDDAAVMAASMDALVTKGYLKAKQGHVRLTSAGAKRAYTVVSDLEFAIRELRSSFRRAVEARMMTTPQGGSP